MYKVIPIENGSGWIVYDSTQQSENGRLKGKYFPTKEDAEEYCHQMNVQNN